MIAILVEQFQIFGYNENSSIVVETIRIKARCYRDFFRSCQLHKTLPIGSEHTWNYGCLSVKIFTKLAHIIRGVVVVCENFSTKSVIEAGPWGRRWNTFDTEM